MTENIILANAPKAIRVIAMREKLKRIVEASTNPEVKPDTATDEIVADEELLTQPTPIVKDGKAVLEDHPNKNEADLIREISAFINARNLENGSDTPDFILAEYLADALRSFNKVTKARDKWYGEGASGDNGTAINGDGPVETVEKIEAAFKYAPPHMAENMRFIAMASYSQSNINPESLTLITDFYAGAIAAAKKVKAATSFTVQAADGAESSVASSEGDGENLMRILTDPDSLKLVTRLYTDYVSEEDTSKIAQFFIAFDALLFKFRDGKPLSRDEIEELDEIQQVRVAKKKQRRAKKAAAPVEDEDLELETVDIG